MRQKRTMSSQAEPSWCRTTLGDTAEATIRWTIDKFMNRPEKNKESLKSIYFNMNGPGDLKTKWQLQIYPKGNKVEFEDYVSLYLWNKSDFKVNAEYKIHNIDGSGKERDTGIKNTAEFDISGIVSSWGRKKWLKRDHVFNDHPDLLPDGNLTLQCTITVFGPEKVLSGSDLDSRNPNLLAHCQKQVCQQLGNAFFEKQFTDIMIKCEGQTFYCHKAVLAARSPVFLAMFEANMKEKVTNTVAIDDFKPEVVSEMLSFIYTGNISSQDAISDLATELLAAADKYQLDLLRNVCEERLCSTLEVTNCVEYLVLGDMYYAFKLKEMALRLVVENVDSLTDRDVFKDLFTQKPDLAFEIMKASRNK